jgi:hypothetical protein
MVLSDEQLKKFQQLYKTHFNKEITSGEAYEKGIKLICLLRSIYKPMTEEEFIAIQKHIDSMSSLQH